MNKIKDILTLTAIAGGVTILGIFLERLATKLGRKLKQVIKNIRK